MTPSVDRIAIVGLGGVFPGAKTIAGFWDNVAQARDSGRPVPANRWALSPEKALAAEGWQPDRVYSTWGCFLDDVPDAPPELSDLDPLVRIGLKAAVDAVADARQPAVDPTRAGIIFGHIVLPTESTSGLAREVLLREFENRVLAPSRPSAGARGQAKWSGANWDAAALPATIIARALGWRGTAYTLDAACASSLYALKLAGDELLSHRADVMLAGGLSRPDCQYTQMGFAALQALSKRGRCAPLSSAADGLVVGEGAGLFMLKRLSDAVRDGDRIYATIAGIGLSNDRGANLLAPRSEGQLRAMQSAYRQAGWQPGDVDLIECHATGTPVGDAVELVSLHTLWREEEGSPKRCVLGSVKSNVGHLLTAAGGASLMKLLFALQTRTLPPTANYDQPAAALDRPDSPFRVLSQAEPWEPRDPQTPRRAAINAFGFGGINAHVLLEEWREESSTGVGPRGFLGADSSSTPYRFPLKIETEQPLDDAVAIVGLAAHVGPWSTLDDVQERLFGGRESDQPRCPNGWDLSTDRAGFPIDEVRVPLGSFRIPPVELEEMLPQQQLMLQVTAAALDDAGLPHDLGDRTGVFVGIGLDPNTTNFHCRWTIAEHAPRWAEQLGLSLSPDELDGWIHQLRDSFGPPLTANRVMGNLGGIVASRLAREFDVGGPSFTVSSHAASGGHALEIAMRALQRGELDRAIVGAVDLPSDIRIQLQTMPDHASQPFADAAVAVIVKRHADAVRDGDRIYAVIPSESRDRQGAESGTVLIVDDNVLAPSPPSAGERAGVRGRALASGSEDLCATADTAAHDIEHRSERSGPLTLTLSPEAGGEGTGEEERSSRCRPARGLRGGDGVAAGRAGGGRNSSSGAAAGTMEQRRRIAIGAASVLAAGPGGWTAAGGGFVCHGCVSRASARLRWEDSHGRHGRGTPKWRGRAARRAQSRLSLRERAPFRGAKGDSVRIRRRQHRRYSGRDRRLPCDVVRRRFD